MKNNCDVSGEWNHAICKSPRSNAFERCDFGKGYHPEQKGSLCAYVLKDMHCTNLAAIRAAIESEKNDAE